MENPPFKLLYQLDLNPNEYLKIARKTAKREGYDPKLLFFSDGRKHKLMYKGTKFGSAVNGDYIIYKMLVEKGIYDKEFAEKKRKAYRARAKGVMEDTDDNESRASLSYYILW